MRTIRYFLLGLLVASGLVGAGVGISVVNQHYNKDKVVEAYGLVAPTGLLDVIVVYADGHSVQLAKVDAEAQQKAMAEIRKLPDDKKITVEASVEIGTFCTQADEG